VQWAAVVKVLLRWRQDPVALATAAELVAKFRASLAPGASLAEVVEMARRPF